jgi:hypothetical protein
VTVVVVSSSRILLDSLPTIVCEAGQAGTAWITDLPSHSSKLLELTKALCWTDRSLAVDPEDSKQRGLRIPDWGETQNALAYLHKAVRGAGFGHQTPVLGVGRIRVTRSSRVPPADGGVARSRRERPPPREA